MSNLAIQKTSWKDEELKVYYVYRKGSGEVWSVSTDREARDCDFRELRQVYPNVKLGKLTKVVKRKDLFKRINQKKVKR